jgi:hypothetical protein
LSCTATRRRAVLLLAAGLLLVRPAPGLAKDADCELAGVPRVVAVGDVHGAYPELVAVLQLAGIVDEKEHWVGGSAHLVQTGDLLDRGTELLMRLEGEARSAGGRVHALLGNHEVMNLLGDLRYVNREEYKAWETPRSRTTRERFYHSAVLTARENARATGQDFDEDAFRTRFDEQAPLGFVERTESFSAKGRYGLWLRGHQTMVRINGIAFVHGGLSPEVAALGCEAINAKVRREITVDIDKTQANPTEALATSETGPLWYRGLAREDETAFLPSVEKILQSIGATTIVIGHTVTGTGHIEPRFGTRVVMIDAGMNPLYGRHLAALDASGGRLTAFYEGRHEDLARPAAARLAPFDFSPGRLVPAAW